MDKRNIASHSVGCYVRSMWVVCKGENSEVVAVMDSKEYAKELSEYLAAKYCVECTYFQVPPVDNVL